MTFKAELKFIKDQIKEAKGNEIVIVFKKKYIFKVIDFLNESGYKFTTEEAFDDVDTGITIHL